MSSAITSFADLLRHLRTTAALSQEELAIRSGLSLRGISDLERGVRRAPHLTTVRVLADALALSDAERQALLAAARPGTVSDMPEAAPGRYAPLVLPLTPLLGRERELATLVSLLQDRDVRLVTLTGAGGSGKTRLALEVGAHLSRASSEGTVFVDLTPLRNAEFVLPTIAAALGVRERPGQPLLDTLARFLEPKHLLLLLDNCEQVLGAAPQIAALVAVCPHLSVIATSRAALRVRGEHEVSIPPLPVPVSDRPSSLAELAHVPAVALFLERAAASQPTFALSTDNAAAVAAICRRLDGLPLAIELAAAWVRVLTPAALLERLEQRLLLLTGGSRDLPARQRTMRDAIAWSYELLTESEQALFRCLAVFAGGWTLEAAEVVSCGRNTLHVLTGLETFIAASLVQVVEHPDGERRFRMLETVREFGMEQLTCHGELDEVSRRHADYFFSLAQAGGAAISAGRPREWLTRLEAERANLRAALSWLRERGEYGLGLRLAAALGGFWHVRSANAEGRMWLESFLALSPADDESHADRIAALRWAGELAGLEGDLTSAQIHLERSLALARRAGDTCGVAAALRAIGSALFQQGQVAACIEPLSEAIALTRELGDQRQTAFLLAYLAVAIAHQGDFERAEVMIAESRELFGALGDTGSFEANLGLVGEGLTALIEGNHDRAEDRLNAALSLGQVLDSKALVSVTLGGLGEIALARGQREEAAARCREGVIQGWGGDYPLGIAWSLMGLVRLASHYCQLTSAARLIGGLTPYSGLIQALPPASLVAYEASVVRVQTSMGQQAFTEAHEVGRVLPLEELVSEGIALGADLMGQES
ncbi:MAG TPA: helix-turn-helix domain-containing protein [Gemmatimonadales bacterium]|nr:helix-turn-helix domain-containing protein [Gemmatimonadales bacterium]